MDLRSVSNPTVASQNNQLDSSVSRQLLIDAPRPARAASLSSTKVEPGFGDLLKMEPDLATRIESNDGQSTEPSQLEEKFTEFVGQTLFGSMLASMRKTLDKPAYMHGGRTEEVFQKQLDQLMVEDLTKASADSIASPMFDLFNMQKRS
jgi:peptidoglycan hydrolase FlgJ